MISLVLVMDTALLDVLYKSAVLNVNVKKEYTKRGRKYDSNGNRYFTYALLLQDNKIYVGDTNNIYMRLLNHFEMSDASSKWVKMHGPVKRILEITYDAPEGAENERTLEFSDIFGHENVRGGFYCKVNQNNAPDALHFFERGQVKHNFMPREEIKRIERQIRELID
jgi:predicted GIY-YIG superfamily endonuclease